MMSNFSADCGCQLVAVSFTCLVQCLVLWVTEYKCAIVFVTLFKLHSIHLQLFILYCALVSLENVWILCFSYHLVLQLNMWSLLPYTAVRWSHILIIWECVALCTVWHSCNLHLCIFWFLILGVIGLFVSCTIVCILWLSSFIQCFCTCTVASCDEMQVNFWQF